MVGLLTVKVTGVVEPQAIEFGDAAKVKLEALVIGMKAAVPKYIELPLSQLL